MENIDAFLASCSSNLLAESFWVFSNPIQVPQWTLLSASELQEFSPPVPACTLTQRPPGGVSFLRTLSSPGFLPCNLCTMPFWQSFSESSVILVFLNSQWGSSPTNSCYAQCPLGRAPTELKFCLRLCLSYTALPPEVFSNLTGLPPELLIPVLCLSTSSSDSSEFRSASSCALVFRVSTLCHALMA
jgi:hypothetical protein